ncbi:histidine kinase [Nonomuraea jabiensis]|uniref:histidine kinase n=1 Tax=Nonomuraea jabiensis TaxID=882448 RepID=A0A7W9G9B6_9ACTN|nr:histidine kinase [Nonomuraea jabiensis]MBB5779481.1 signal transduction histidine kinase [Nonomuraea jabiensis]
MQVTPPLPLLRRVPSGLWTALAWSAGLALTFLMRVRLPGEAEPAYSPGVLLYHGDGLSFLIVATALVVAGSILLDRRPLPALTLLLAASAVACMPLGVGEIPSAQFLAVDAALYFIAATAPRRTSIAAIAMSLITLAGYLGTRLLFGWVVGTSAELAVAMTAVIAWLVGRSVHQAHVHAESQRVQATAQAIIGERLRIARELHDMVAHSIGIIALQAGAARRVIDTQPVRAREALGEIETVGRETLSGLRRMLGALRHPKPAHPPQSEPSDRSAPVDQQPGALPNPAQLSQSESSGRSMLIDQDPGALPAPAQLSQSESSGRSMLVDQQLGALLDRPAPTAQRPDALLGQYASVEPSQRTWSDCPESGQEPVAVPLGPPESGPTPSTAPLDSGLIPLDPSLAPLDAGPAPAGLADLERLAATTTAAGVQVEVRWRGVRRPLPPEIDMSAYRIVQEAVTNVTRHAEHPSCQVTIDFGDEELAIEVIDPAPSPQPSLPPDPSPDLSSGRSTGLAPGRSTGLSPDCGSGLSADSGSGFSLGPGSGLASGRSPGFSSGLGSGLGSGHSPGLFSDSGSGPSLDASRAAAPALDINPAADRSPRLGPSPDASLSLDSGPGLGDVPAHSSGSGAGRGFGFGGGRGPGRGRKARGGYGLVGMRERVALLHGVFSAGPRQEGGFRVVARLPVPARVR